MLLREPTSTKRKRVSKDPEVRREELLQTASALFENKGVTATSIADITDGANVARGTFYLYFKSKDDVIAELWKRYVAGFLSDATGTLEREPPQGRATGYQIIEFLVHLANHALEHAHLHRLVYGTADAAAIALCKQSDEAILKTLVAAIKTLLERERRTGRDAELLASFIFHGLDGALHRAIMPGAPIDRDGFVKEVKRFAIGALGLSPDAHDSA